VQHFCINLQYLTNLEQIELFSSVLFDMTLGVPNNIWSRMLFERSRWQCVAEGTSPGGFEDVSPCSQKMFSKRIHCHCTIFELCKTVSLEVFEKASMITLIEINFERKKNILFYDNYFLNLSICIAYRREDGCETH
jgi:hypothetical protein